MLHTAAEAPSWKESRALACSFTQITGFDLPPPHLDDQAWSFDSHFAPSGLPWVHDEAFVLLQQAQRERHTLLFQILVAGVRKIATELNRNISGSTAVSASTQLLSLTLNFTRTLP